MLLSQLANKEIGNFLRTVTIKNKFFAQQMLELKVKDLVQDYLPEKYNPYYRHINGEYILDNRVPGFRHDVVNPTTGVIETQYIETSVTLRDPAGLSIDDTKVMTNSEVYNPEYFDEVMYITSLDTQTTIPFTKENLHAKFALAAGRDENSVHKKTLANYKLPSRYYTLLCEKYPKQVDLIKAIVYPIDDLESAIAADNYTALSYDDSLLDANERVSLISRMKGLLDIIRYRWDVKEYQYEEHYAMVVWGMIWNLLITHLRAQRFVNIRTPDAHSQHIWEYLNSHGLGKYRGYLSSSQEMFLYRNLRFILANRGKQSTLNLLIDELLNESGADIRAKTIVLDTSNVMKGELASTSSATQCQTCSKRITCKKNITSYSCIDYVGVDDQCKPIPIVLTEEFAGSSKLKIYEILQTQYNYTYDEAVEKYSRSFLWVDKEIEEIKTKLDRDQIVDINGDIETLDNLISREHRAGLEPVYNSDIVEDQYNTLRHIPCTWLPTKVLEISKMSYNPKYFDMFNMFVTHTLLRFAAAKKCDINYRFKITDDTADSIFDFNEMLNVLYLGVLRENRTVLIRDDVDVPVVNWNLNQVKDICSLCAVNCALPTEDNDGNTNYEVAIPNKAYVYRAFKFNKPVKQADVEYAVNNTTSPDDQNILDSIDMSNKKLMTTSIGMYVIEPVERASETDQCSKCSKYGYCSKRITNVLCMDYLRTGKVLGTVIKGFGEAGTTFTYKSCGDEIGIIPTYFRWNNQHLYAADSGEGIDTILIRPASSYNTYDGSVATYSAVHMLYDSSKQDDGIIYRVENYVNVDYIINHYSEVPDDIKTQSELGGYLTNMFNLMKTMQQSAIGSNDTLYHEAMRHIFNSVLYRDRISFDLVNTGKNSLTSDGSRVSTYSDWLAYNKDTKLVLDSLDHMSGNIGWNSLTTKIVDLLLEDCTLPYTATSADITKYAKLKELVVQLSSYNISIIDTNDEDSTSVSFAPITNSDSDRELIFTSVEHFDSILATVKRPHAAHGSIINPDLISRDTPYEVSYFNGKWYERAGVLSTYLVEVPASAIDAEKTIYDEVRNVTSYVKSVTKTSVTWEAWSLLTLEESQLDKATGVIIETESEVGEDFATMAEENFGKNEIIIDNNYTVISDEPTITTEITSEHYDEINPIEGE